jgi:hypothetical protein
MNITDETRLKLRAMAAEIEELVLTVPPGDSRRQKLEDMARRCRELLDRIDPGWEDATDDT